jgi:uncharacterized membrane protein
VALFLVWQLRNRVDQLERESSELRRRLAESLASRKDLSADERQQIQDETTAEPSGPSFQQAPVAASYKWLEEIREKRKQQQNRGSGESNGSQSIDWESLIGRYGLGLAAVLTLLVGTGFFLRYALEHDWIGPTGQVGLGVLAGVILLGAGRRMDTPRFVALSRILTGAGLLLIYLSTYAAFGYFHLIRQATAGPILLTIIVLGSLIAVGYNSWLLGLMTVLGGLLNPVLLVSPDDQYQSLFIYLALLNLGTLVIVSWRSWSLLASLVFMGSQILFGLWYATNYHPEKLGWAVAFQVTLWGLHVAQRLLIRSSLTALHPDERLVRIVLVPVVCSGMLHVLLARDYEPWLGSLAILLATLYALFTRVSLSTRQSLDDQRESVAFLAVCVGFMSVAIPIEAQADWVALGWAAIALPLWAFGLRIQSRALRVMAAVLATLSLVRLLTIDMPWHMSREPFWPVLNTYALPALAIVAILAMAVAIGFRFRENLSQTESRTVGIVGLGTIVLAWIILSVDLSTYFEMRAETAVDDDFPWRWIGQLALTILWATYGAIWLIVGLMWHVKPIRWLAFALLALTLLKVFLVDMEEVGDLYRVAAFLGLAVLLGLSTWLYQKLIPHNSTPSAEDKPR